VHNEQQQPLERQIAAAVATAKEKTEVKNELNKYRGIDRLNVFIKPVIE
jgi:hypothetical protein